jgi:Acyltransferase C-terminus
MYVIFVNRGFFNLADDLIYVASFVKAYAGYDGSLPSSIQPLSITSLFFKVFRRKFPKEIHIRIKRYSIEEVLHIDNVAWLVKKWSEKDRLLTHFAKFQQFPNDSRGYYGRPRVFNTRFHSLESSIGSLFRLCMITSAVPVLVLVSVPLSWTVLWIWVVTKAIEFLHIFVSGSDDTQNGSGVDRSTGGRNTPGSVPSSAGTPFLPATPFVSPNNINWNHTMFSSDSKGNISKSMNAG